MTEDLAGNSDHLHEATRNHAGEGQTLLPPSACSLCSTGYLRAGLIVALSSYLTLFQSRSTKTLSRQQPLPSMMILIPLFLSNSNSQ